MWSWSEWAITIRLRMYWALGGISRPMAFSTARTEAMACTVVQTPQMRWVNSHASRGSRPRRMSSMPRQIWTEAQASRTLPPSTYTSIRRWPSIRVIGSMVIVLLMESPLLLGRRGSGGAQDWKGLDGYDVQNDLEGDYSECDQELGQCGEVEPVRPRAEGDHVGVDPEERAGQQQENRGAHLPQGARTALLREQDRGARRGEQDLGQESDPRRARDERELARHRDLDEAEGHPAQRDPCRHPGEGGEHRGLAPPAEDSRREARFKHHHRVPDHDAIPEEQEREPRREPQRVHPGPRQEHHRSQRRLVHGRQEDPERQDPDESAVHEAEAALRPRPEACVRARPPLLEEGRRELHEQHQVVGRDAQRHLELRRMRPPPEEDRDLPQTPEAPEVEGDREHGETVAQQARQDRGPHERMVLPPVQDVDEKGDGVASAAEGRADDDVERDPDSPRIPVVETAHGADAQEEAVEGDDGPDARDGQQDLEGAGHQLPADGRVNKRLAVHCVASSLMPVSARRLRIITAARTEYSATGATKGRRQ